MPAGLAQERGGAIILNPDEEVQARLHLVFRLFHDLGSAHAVVRSLRHAGLGLPMRPLRGPAPHAVVWRPADGSRVLSILKNPGYAGAYVYGRHWQDPGRRRSGSPRSGTVTRAPEDWPVCLIDAHPGYISWVRPELLIYNHTLISAAQGPIRKGVLHREKTPFIWVPLPGGAKERSDVPSAGDNGLRPGSLDPGRP